MQRHYIMLSLAVTALAAMQSPPMTTARSRAAVSPAAASSPPLLHRRQALAIAVQAGLLLPATAAMAESAPLKDLKDAQFAYSISYPDDWKDGSKPVKTHQHELLLSSMTQKGVKLGVTVDPVKIDSLEAFGSLDQTTERVLGVERTRDGVKEVTLRANAAEVSEGQPTYYTIDYVTDSSRGKKIYCCERGIKPRKPSRFYAGCMLYSSHQPHSFRSLRASPSSECCSLCHARRQVLHCQPQALCAASAGQRRCL